MMDLMLDNGGTADIDRDTLISTLKGISLVEGNIAVLSSEPETYIQTMVLGGGFVIEKRDGSAESHFEALPRDLRPKTDLPKPWWQFWGKPTQANVFTREELLSAFLNYFDGKESPELLTWNSIRI